jgi:hypothetical protein
MLRRVETDERPQRAQQHAPAVEPEHAVPVVGDSDLGTSLLPRDHPKWHADALSVSQRARELIARLRPVAVRVFTFWDHRVRSVTIGSARLQVDAAGSYCVR